MKRIKFFLNVNNCPPIEEIFEYPDNIKIDVIETDFILWKEDKINSDWMVVGYENT